MQPLETSSLQLVGSIFLGLIGGRKYIGVASLDREKRWTKVAGVDPLTRDQAISMPYEKIVSFQWVGQLQFKWCLIFRQPFLKVE